MRTILLFLLASCVDIPLGSDPDHGQLFACQVTGDAKHPEPYVETVCAKTAIAATLVAIDQTGNMYKGDVLFSCVLKLPLRDCELDDASPSD